VLNSVKIYRTYGAKCNVLLFLRHDVEWIQHKRGITVHRCLWKRPHNYPQYLVDSCTVYICFCYLSAAPGKQQKMHRRPNG